MASAQGWPEWPIKTTYTIVSTSPSVASTGLRSRMQSKPHSNNQTRPLEQSRPGPGRWPGTRAAVPFAPLASRHWGPAVKTCHVQAK